MRNDMYVEGLGMLRNFDATVARRPNALHVVGVAGCSTKDIFRYFLHHTPLCVEWISDSACNVVWEDGAQTMGALLANTELMPEGLEENLPLFLRWRRGRPIRRHDGHSSVFLRPATFLDMTSMARVCSSSGQPSAGLPAVDEPLPTGRAGAAGSASPRSSNGRRRPLQPLDAARRGTKRQRSGADGCYNDDMCADESPPSGSKRWATERYDIITDD